MYLNTNQFNTSNDIIHVFTNYFSNIYENYEYYVNVDNKQYNPPQVFFSLIQLLFN